MLVEQRENEQITEEQRRKEMIKQDEILAKKLAKDSGPRNLRVASGKVKKPKVKSDKPRKPNTAFTKEFEVSPALAEIIGVNKSSRPQVVKLLWDYIKTNNLQDPSDKRSILCDEKLENFFNKSMYIKFMLILLTNREGEFIRNDEGRFQAHLLGFSHRISGPAV